MGKMPDVAPCQVFRGTSVRDVQQETAQSTDASCDPDLQERLSTA